MKQKIVINVVMHNDKCRRKALQIAAGEEGVSSVAVEGEEKVVVIGEGVDSVCLAKALRKKFGHASILSVSEVKPEKKEEKKQEIKPCFYYPPPCPPCYSYVVCDPCPDNNCTIS